MEWVGPFTIDQLLNNLFDPSVPLPPISDGVSMGAIKVITREDKVFMDIVLRERLIRRCSI